MLHRTFSSTSQARLIELQQQLQGITKGESICAEYIQKIRSIVDELAFIRSPIFDGNFMNYTLRGLGTDFNTLVLAVTTRSEPIALPDLHALLLTSEKNRLNSQYIAHSLPATPDLTAFYSNHIPRPYNSRPSSHPRPSYPRNNYRPPFNHQPNSPYTSPRPQHPLSLTPNPRPLPSQFSQPISITQMPSLPVSGNSSDSNYAQPDKPLVKSVVVIITKLTIIIIDLITATVI